MSEASAAPTFNYDDESHGQRLARKSKESPFMVVGLTGLVAACGLGAYKFRHRGGMSPSVFLMQLRVIAQGSVIGALTVGLVYSIYNTHLKPKDALADGHKPAH